MRITRARESFDGDTVARPGLDLDPLLGSWTTFRPGGDNVSRVDVESQDGAVTARAFGSDAEGTRDWGPVEARVFADDVDGDEVWGFRADYDLGFQRVAMYGYLNRGLLAIDIATSFADDSGRSDYYSRIFFHRP